MAGDLSYSKVLQFPTSIDPLYGWVNEEVLGAPSIISNKYFQGLKEEILSTLEEQEEYVWEVLNEDE